MPRLFSFYGCNLHYQMCAEDRIYKRKLDSRVKFYFDEFELREIRGTDRKISGLASGRFLKCAAVFESTRRPYAALKYRYWKSRCGSMLRFDFLSVDFRDAFIAWWREGPCPLSGNSRKANSRGIDETRRSGAAEKWSRDHLDADRNSASPAILNHVAVANFRALRMRAVFLFFFLPRSGTRSALGMRLGRLRPPAAVHGGRAERRWATPLLKRAAHEADAGPGHHAVLHFSPTPLLWY